MSVKYRFVWADKNIINYELIQKCINFIPLVKYNMLYLSCFVSAEIISNTTLIENFDNSYLLQNYNDDDQKQIIKAIWYKRKLNISYMNYSFLEYILSVRFLDHDDIHFIHDKFLLLAQDDKNWRYILTFINNYTDS